MTIESVHSKLINDGVFTKADQITDAITDIQDECDWLGEQFKAAYSSFAKEAARREEKEYLNRLHSAYETFQALVETVDDARRDFGWAMEQMNQRPANGESKPLPRDDYEMPILDAILALGGSGRARDVLDAVGKAMSGILPVVDLNPVKSSGEPRWRKIAQWAKYEMILKGLLNPDAPRGVWELSEEGRLIAQKRAIQGLVKK